jgi:hypothetical protein
MLAEEVERLVGERLDMDGQLGIVQIDPPPARLLDAAADFPLDLRRGHGKPLVRAPHRDAKRSRILGIEIAQDLARDRIDVERSPSRAGEIADPKNLGQTVAHAGPIRAVTEHNFDTALQGTHLPHIEISRGLTDVPDEPRHEPGPVLALEGDLRVVDDDGLHEVLDAKG